MVIYLIMQRFLKYLRRNRIYVMLFVSAAVIALIGWAGYVYSVSPAPIRRPQLEHAHLRIQLFVDGDAVDFGQDKFQEPYDPGQCSADITDTPIHFHDNKDQFLHLHWKGITGGMVLKYYGWNFAGGPNNLLGYRLDELPKVKSVKIYDDALPEYPKNAKLWIYTGGKDQYKQRSSEDFVNKDFEEFFGVRSNVNVEVSSWIDRLFPSAYAHGGSHSGEGEEDESDEERLSRIQNLLGNVVIFAQKDKPSDDKVKEAFEHLDPLEDSTCGG